MVEYDHQLLLLINGMHTGFLDAFMWLVSGKLVWIPFYVMTLVMVWRNRGWQGVVQLLLLVGVMMLMTDMVNSQLIRPFFHRLRPANLDSPVGPMVHIVNGYRGGMYGFPSAHAANYCGLSILVCYFVRNRWLTLHLALLTLLVCYSRSYLGVHYPGDLTAGILYAALVTSIIIWVHHRYLPLPKIDHPRLTWLPGLTIALTLTVFAALAVAG